MLHRYTNRLINERSPYLLQHAHNPVDWYPWGQGAFELARSLNRPIFLSVGYSTCHWCHVMERESFEEESVASVMNKYFVNVKVDRECLPNVDRVYMAFVQATTGTGGWPMSVWLTPDLKPIFGGTYFSPFDSVRAGRHLPGFVSICQEIGERWQSDPDSLIKQSSELTLVLEKAYKLESDPLHRVPPVSVLDKAYRYFERRYDGLYGGFGGAPKFPTPVQLNFLLSYHSQLKRQLSQQDFTRSLTKDKQSEMELAIVNSLQMTLHTLRQIARGGIHDHIGAGFHRYSVDRRWHVPHFEKMLYDQGQLLRCYSDAYSLCGEPEFAECIRDIATYIQRDLWNPDGAFYSAEDADSFAKEGDSEKREGAWAVWTWDQLKQALPDTVDFQIFEYRYGVGKDGNCDESNDPHGELVGQNVLYEKHSIPETANHFDMSLEGVKRRFLTMKENLFQLRQQRPKPHLDDKIIVSWNGLAISGLAKASNALPAEDETTKKRLYGSAIKTVDFIRRNLWKNGHLLRGYRGDGPIKDAPAACEDYAFLIQGLMDLYHCRFDDSLIEWASELQAKQDELFWDKEHGAYYSGRLCQKVFIKSLMGFIASFKEKEMIFSMKDDHDGAEPTANSVSLCNLVRLGGLTGENSYINQAGKLLWVFHNERFMENPFIMPQLLVGLSMYHMKPRQIVISGEPDTDNMAKQMLSELSSRYIPDAVIFLANSSKKDGFLAKNNAVYHEMITASEGRKSQGFVCKDFICHRPVDNAKDLVAQL